MTIDFPRRTRQVLAALALAVTGLLPTIANAQTFPSQAVRIIVPFPPGGAADSFSRLLGQKLTELWGSQQVVVENKAGAGGVIGTEAAAKATGDGHTLLMVTVGHAVNPFIFSKLPYDTRKDFVPIAVIANVPSLFVTGPKFTGKTFREFLEAGKAKPGTLEFGSSGIGSTSHVGAALIESMTGIDLLHVPYKGAAPALQDVMGGRIAASVDIITSSLQLVKSQKLTALAITSARRSPLLPDVPTVAEAGLPGYEFTAWYLLLAPARTPAAIIEKINDDVRKVEAMADFKTRIQDAGGEVANTSVSEAAAFLDSEFTKWGKVVKDRNIKAD